MRPIFTLFLILALLPALKGTSQIANLEISGPTFVCPGSVNTYSIPSQSGNVTILWSFPTGTSVVEQNGNIVTVLWGFSSGSICVTVNTGNGNQESECLSVMVAPNAAPTFVDTSICEGAFLIFGGEILTQDGTYTNTFTNQFGCDSLVILDLGLLPSPIKQINVQKATCNQSNGKASIVLSNGVIPNLIQWSTGEVGVLSVNNLAPGNYNVIVTTDDCVDDLSFSILNDAFCDVRISGYVFNNQTVQNCVDTDVDGGLENIPMRLFPTNEVQFTDANGYFEFIVDTGSYQLEAVLPGKYDLLCPNLNNNKKQLIFNEQGSFSDTNMYYLAASNFRDAAVNVSPGPVNLGDRHWYKIEFCNEGTDTTNGTLSFQHDENEVDFFADLPPAFYDASARKAFWNVSDVPPGECVGFYVYFTLSPQATADFISGCASVSNQFGQDDEEDNNLRCWSLPVIYSGTDIEKLVFVSDNPYGEPIASSDTTMHYQIRFRNTGMDTVYGVKIRDTIDPLLDLATFKIGGSSHFCTFSLEPGNVIEIDFPGIKLAPNIQDTFYSVGFVNFTIDMSFLADFGDQISNRAQVIYGFSPPVSTNKVTNLIISKNLSISGLVLTENLDPVSGVEATLMGAIDDTATSDEEGIFQFQNILAQQDYSIKLSKNNFLNNGVTTFDLVKIQKHILGVELLGSPFKKIAADANNSGTITTSDIVELRKLILGIINNLPNNESWRFVSADFNFPSLPPSQVGSFPEIVNVYIDGSSKQKLFAGVKVGDVTGDVDPQGFGPDADDRSSIALLLPDMDLQVGQIVDIHLSIESLEQWQAIQFSLEFDIATMDILDVQAVDWEGFDENSFYLKSTGEKISLNLAWFDLTPLNHPVSLVLKVKALKNAKLRDVLHLSSESLLPLAYTGSGIGRSFHLDWREEGAGANTSCRVTPNPTRGNALFSYNLNAPSEVELQVFDQLGRLIFSQTAIGQKGENSVLLSRELFPASGLYFWVMENEGEAYTGKIVVK